MVGPSVINRCPRWCCASSFAKSPGTTQAHYLKLHGTLPSCTTVNGSEIPRPTTTGWMFLKPYFKKRGGSTTQPPSTGEFTGISGFHQQYRLIPWWLVAVSLTVPAMSWWPALKVVEGRSECWDPNLLLGHVHVATFFFQKKIHQFSLGAYHWRGGGGVFFFWRYSTVYWRV